MTHQLKTIQPYFDQVMKGLKTFELRKRDRLFNAGDTLILKEYDQKSGVYSGRELSAYVSHMMVDKDFNGIAEDWCIMSITGVKQHK